MNKAWHYVGAVVVVILGVWLAGAIPNPLKSLSNNP
jgi:hypothetical protein